MSRWLGIAGIIGLFLLSAAVGALLTDAARGEGPVATPTEGSTSTTTEASITVDVPVWIDTTRGSGQPAVVPAGVGDVAETPQAGLEVVQPSGDSGTTRPAGATGPVDVADVDVVASEALTEEPGDPAAQAEAIDAGALNFVPTLDPSRTRFVDPCATATDGECPFGVPALIALGFPEDVLVLRANTFRGDAGRFDSQGNDLCPSAFVGGEYNIAFHTTAPATIEFAYGFSNDPRSYEQRTIPALQPGEAEYERWVANVGSDLLNGNQSWLWVRTCTALDLDEGTMYTFTPVVARTDDGRVTELTWVPSLDTRPPEGSAGRPPTSIVTRGDDDAFVYVWSRNPGDGYRTVVWPIDMSQPDASSCSDIESDLFFMRRWGMQHDDLGMAVFGVIPALETAPPRVYNPQWGWRQRFDLSLREGRVYTLCTWEARLGEQSFDEWEILEREQIEIVTPNRHQIEMTLTEVGVTGASSTHDLQVMLNPDTFCDNRAPMRAEAQRVSPGMALVNQTFCETRGIGPDPTAFVDLYVDNEHRGTVAMPLRTSRGCELNGPDLLCSSTFKEYFDVRAEIPGTCETQCAWIDARIRVDYLSSNGEGIDRWQIAASGTFTAAPSQPDSGPAVDIFDVELSTVSGRVGAVEASFTVNRPVTFELEVLASGHNEPCNQVASGTGEGRITIVVEGLCADTLYILGDITLTDAAGVTNRQGLTSEVLATWTDGYASFLGFDLRLKSVEDEEVAIEHCRSMDGTYGGVSGGLVGDRCWENVTVGLASRVYMANVSAQPSDRYLCLGQAGSVYSLYAPALENRQTRVAVHSEDVEYDLYILLTLDAGCGIDASSQLPISVIDLDFTVTVDDLDDIGWGTFLEVDGILWEISLSRIDQGIANRSD